MLLEHLHWKLPKIFYGWWVVSACFLITLYTGGAIVLGFTAFFEPIANEFGWSYTQVSLAASLRGVEVGLLAPIAGLLVDRWGPRRLLLAGNTLMGLGLILLSFTTSLGMFYTGFALVAVGMSGSSSTVVFTAATNWFRKKVGLATGIMASGFALGAIIIPIIVWLIDIFDWRTAIIILGLGTFVICLPLAVLVRHKPEKYGYLPDGEERNTLISKEGLTTAPIADPDFRVKQALKSRAFWHVALAMICQYLTVTAVITHIMPYLSSIGMVRATSSLIATAVPLLSIPGRIGCGWLGDRFDKRVVASACFLLVVLGLLSFNYISSEGIWLLVPFLIFFSIGWGGLPTMRVALLSEYFGRHRFGTIHGFLLGLLAFGGIVGPLLAGWVFDNWGSYYAAWLVLACLCFVAVIIMATAPPLGTKY